MRFHIAKVKGVLRESLWLAIAAPLVPVFACVASDPVDGEHEVTAYMVQPPGGGAGPPPPPPQRPGGASPPPNRVFTPAPQDRQCASVGDVQLCVAYDAAQLTATATVEVLSGGPTLTLGLGIAGAPALLTTWSGALATAESKAITTAGIEDANFCAVIVRDGDSEIRSSTICLR